MAKQTNREYGDLGRDGLWLINSRASAIEIKRYCETLRIMANSLDRIRFDANAVQLRDEAGVLSLCLRKLLWERGRYMERIIVRPRFKRLARSFPIAGGAVVMRLHGLQEGLPYNSFYEWHSLPGCSVTDPGLCCYSFYSAIFEEEGSSMMGIKQWLKQPLIGIWSIPREGRPMYKQLSMKGIMNFIRNTQGAHIDMSSDPDGIDNDFLCLVGDNEGFSYFHWIVICMSIYIYNRQYESAKARPDIWQKYVDDGSIVLLNDTIDIMAEPTFVPIRMPINSNEAARLVTPATGLGNFKISEWTHPKDVYKRYDRTGSVRENGTR